MSSIAFSALHHAAIAQLTAARATDANSNMMMPDSSHVGFARHHHQQQQQHQQSGHSAATAAYCAAFAAAAVARQQHRDDGSMSKKCGKREREGRFRKKRRNESCRPRT